MNMNVVKTMYTSLEWHNIATAVLIIKIHMVSDNTTCTNAALIACNSENTMLSANTALLIYENTSRFVIQNAISLFHSNLYRDRFFSLKYETF